MTPDELALHYAILREARGAIRSQNLDGMRGERCARCREGYQTTVVRRRRRTTHLITGQASWWDGEEKLVCGLCWQRAALVHGSDEATRLTPRWKGIQDRDVVGAIQSSIRVGASEDRLAKQADEWNRTAPYLEVVPPGVERLAWRRGVESLILFQHAQVGSYADVADLGIHVFPDLGPWTARGAERAIGLARVWIRRRIETPRWPQREARMKAEDAITITEAARVLNCSRWTIYNYIRDGDLEAIDVSRPGSQRPVWRVSRSSVLAFCRTEPGSVGGGGQQMQTLAWLGL